MARINKCSHQFSQTKLIFRGKAMTHYVVPFDNNLVQAAHYATVKVICDMCNTERVYKYNASPSWLKLIMDKLNNKAPITEG